MMDVVFGLRMDGGAWPEHGGEGAGAVGAPVVGPLGLIEILETARGMGAPSIANVVRIAAFQAALEQLDGPERFWTRSLGVDGWATARTLLRWRDELVEAGWSADRDWSAGRLGDLAAGAAAAAASGLPSGMSDRIAALALELESRPALPIRRMRLVDARDAHPVGWRRLIDRMEDCGVVIEEVESAPSAPADTALGRLQRWMVDGGTIDGEADGSVTIATSASEALAAEVVGQWFSARGDRGDILIAQEADTHLLDLGLAGSGQPRAGRSGTSAHRGSLQILLLAFKVGWSPFDPRALMELLVFPRSPIAGRAARRLAGALEQAPGRGGPEWQRAWEEVEGREVEAAEGDASTLRKARARLDRWRAWADPSVFDPVGGMPLAVALAICDRTAAWATVRHELDGDPLYIATAALATDVRRALVALGRDSLPRTLVERIIDQALDVGHDNPMAIADAAAWRSVAHPGGMWGPAEAVVWWNFGATAEAAQRQPWTETERRELADHDCDLDPPGVAARAASVAWERAVLNAGDRLLLVTGGLDAGDDEALHPLAHRLTPATGRLATRVRIEDALSSDGMVLAGVNLTRGPSERRPLPESRTLWATPSGYAARAADLSHSATSFEAGLGCHLMWALKHVARLRPGRVRSIPDANQLLGNVAHALAHEIFVPGEPPTPEVADARARELLDRMIDDIAAPLRLPELAAQLADARERLPAAMAELARTLVSNGLAVEVSELQVSATFENALAVRGAVDLVARDRAGRHVIIDLKWTRSPKRRLEELKEGRAVQLATYGAMVAGDAPYRAGYFLLNQRQFATLADGGLIGRSVDARRGFRDTWAAVGESWRRLGEVAEAGGLVACGIDGFDEHLPGDLPIALEAECRWCDYQTLCRVRGLK